MSNKKFLILIFVVSLIALGLRFANLTVLPVFADEAIYVRWAQVMRVESSLRFLPLSDGKQPLFMWTVIPFLKTFSDPLFAGRVVSVLSGLGTMLGIATLSMILFENKKAALLSSFIYAFSPFAFFFDRLAVVDSMLTMFGVWSLIFLVLTAVHLRLDTALLAGFSLGAAYITKSPALFFFILSPVTLLLVKNPRKKCRIFKAAGLLSVSWVLGYAIYNILRLGPNFHLLSSRNYDYVYPYSHILTSPLDPLLPYLDRSLEWFRILGPVPVILMFLAGILAMYTSKKKALLILLAWGIVPIFIVSEFAKVATARYILFTVPYIFVIAGYFISISKKHIRAAYILIIWFALHSLFINIKLITDPAQASLPNSERSGYLEEWSAGTGIKESADILKDLRDRNPDRQIIVGTEGYFGTLPDGLQVYLEREPRITVIGVGLGISEIPPELANAKQSGDLVYLVANSSRLKFPESFEESGMKVVYSVEKAERLEKSSHEYHGNGDRDTFYLLEVLE